MERYDMAKKVEQKEMASAIKRSLRIGDDPEPRLHKTVFYAIMRANGLGSQPYTLRAEWARFTESEYCYTMANPQKDIAVLNAAKILEVSAEGGDIYTHRDDGDDGSAPQRGGYIHTPKGRSRSPPGPTWTSPSLSRR